MMERNLKKEAVQYFKQQPVMVTCLQVMQQKYATYGKLTGTIPKRRLERLDLTPLLRYFSWGEWEYEKQKSISIKKFIDIYNESVYGEIPFEAVIEGVLGEPLVSNQARKEKIQQQHQAFIKAVRTFDKRFENAFANEPKSIFFEWYLENERECLSAFRTVARSIARLPTSYTRLPVFAHQVTGSPHAFDTNTRTGKLLQYMLRDILQKENEMENILEKDVITNEQATSLYSAAEKENELYASFHLIKDDIMNFVAVNGLRAFQGDQPLPLWDAACDAKQTWNVPVRQLLSVDRIEPALQQKLFLIENSGVYSILLDRFPTLPMICSNGQFRYAVWLLLERLDSKTEIYYSGDLDPEGMLIAERLYARYPNQVKLLQMDLEAYTNVKPTEKISERRLKILDQLTHPSLLKISEKVRQQQMAGYQEGVIEALINQIETLIE